MMVGLIYVVPNDYALTAIYIGIIAILLVRKRKRNDLTTLILGLAIMTFFEYLFISTGVEKFSHTTFLNTMPLWLPFLWAYGFVAIKRSVEVLDR